ncbi:hypothetical protein KR222_002742, partial [Zaprionus bogoriensis]
MLTFLALCSAELGYQYQRNTAGLAHETDNNQPEDHYQTHADFHKHFYAFEAPYDSEEETELVEQKLADVAQKNLQVVFIKAPENKAVQGALNALTKQSSEDKTAIFVLNKQTDSNELASKLSALQARRKHKPQVHFVKYRTDAEAAHAQQHIQAQYAAAVPPEPLSSSSLGYSELYLPEKEILTPPLSYPQEAAAVALPQPAQEPAVQTPAPLRSYLPPVTNFVTPPPSYNPGLIDLPPEPLGQQQLAPSLYDLEARTARSRPIDFRANERHRPNSRIVFPTSTPARSYLP